ncbi:hypothetical protein DFH08DRAFT_944234 [Mycena albidolilacea]|uniref:Uncharacterized protein n=1 Tax=Mycena albidolilacea TaxID=1033008 RepID=A0AAD6Z6A6_9AGAR|nr:hypothetical protein DFH08DRAFT_944234 [Mycena albidolilacea]
MPNRHISRDVKIAALNLLDELLELLKHNRFISAHYTTIHRELERAGMSRTILKEIAMERSEPSHMDYVREASQYPAEYLGFLDETSKNDKTPGRRRGRGQKGQRAIKRRKIVRDLSASALLPISRTAQCPRHG